MGVGQQRKPGHPSTTTCITVNFTVPSSNDIGTTLERIARIAAILIAATMAAGYITRQTLTGLASFARNLTSRPLRTLIDLVPVVTPTPAPTPSLLTLLGAEILTDAELTAEIARYDARSQRKRPATTKPSARRKPAAATKVAVGA